MAADRSDDHTRADELLLLPKVAKGRYSLSEGVGLDYDRFRARVARARVAPASAIEEVGTVATTIRHLNLERRSRWARASPTRRM